VRKDRKFAELRERGGGCKGESVERLHALWVAGELRNRPIPFALRAALAGGDSIVTTGLILQELLQGVAGPRARKEIVERFAALPLLIPDRRDYIDAAELRNRCRRSGIQVGTIVVPVRRAVICASVQPLMRANRPAIAIM
jgi:predicted nucleic acid-binding protein